MLAFIMKILWLTGAKFAPATPCFINKNSTAKPPCKNGTKYWYKLSYHWLS